MDTSELNEDLDYDTLEQVAHELLGVYATLANWARVSDPGSAPGFGDALYAQAEIVHGVLLKLGAKD